MEYDYCIIGGGPGGMTLATLLPGNNILIEKEDTLGGCHRVKRVNGLFTEHGPRIYGTSYINTISFLESIGIKWSEYFTDYNFPFLTIGKEEIVKNLYPGEITSLIGEFILFSFGMSNCKISIGEWMTQKSFSQSSIEMIDRICRMTDGADKDRYLLSTFLNLVNQNFFYSFQQPTSAMDKGLIKTWEEKLKVKIYKGEQVLTITSHKVVTDKQSITAKCIIFAMPPQYIVDIIQRSDYNPFSSYIFPYAEKTSYMKYISLTFHWKEKFELGNIYGLAKDSPWGLVFIKLSDYFKDEDGTLFSIAVTKPEMIETISDNEIKQKVWKQMNDIFHFPSYPDKIIVYSGNDKAFVVTKAGYKDFENEKEKIYAISTHAGKSPYSFTSMESAICNAIYLVNKLTGSEIPIKKLWTVDFFIQIFFIIFIVLIIKWIISLDF
jgi:Flavin containing amine oxidoreductase